MLDVEPLSGLPVGGIKASGWAFSERRFWEYFGAMAYLHEHRTMSLLIRDILVDPEGSLSQLQNMKVSALNEYLC